MTFNEWKKAAAEYAVSLNVADGDTLFGELDVYDINDAAFKAHAEGERPELFIDDIFAEEIDARDTESEEQRVAEEEEAK